MGHGAMADQQLDKYLQGYAPFNSWLIAHRYERLRAFFVGRSCLEVGCGDGSGTEHLLRNFGEVTVVDGSDLAIDNLCRRITADNLRTVRGRFEEIDLADNRYDTIVLAHVLEHVHDPGLVLNRAKNHLAAEGRMIIDVPNANSLHRQVGVKMGLLGSVTDLNPADLSIGHRRVYTPDSFRKEIGGAGLEMVHFGGMFIKITSNAQTEEIFSERQLAAMMEVGEENPEIAAEIYVIARLLTA